MKKLKKVLMLFLAERLVAIAKFITRRVEPAKPVRPPVPIVFQSRYITDIGKMAGRIYDLAVKNGWHPEGEDRNSMIERMCNNLHDEVSELHTAHHENRYDLPCDKAAKMDAAGLPVLTAAEEEYADIVIRALDDMMALDIDPVFVINVKHCFNETRPYRHGGKKP